MKYDSAPIASHERLQLSDFAGINDAVCDVKEFHAFKFAVVLLFSRNSTILDAAFPSP